MMLAELNLKNYILIPELKLNFKGGMSAITGETGAGKSILVGALNLVFGKSTAGQIAYDPSKDVSLEIIFQIPKEYKEVHSFLDEAGFPADNDEVIASREFSVSGKNVSYLNGRKTSTSVLKELHDLLIDFHHQRDQQNLLNPAFQLDLLDQFGKHIPLRTEFQLGLQDLKGNLVKLQKLQDAEAANLQLIDLYRFQADELKAAGLTIGEDVTLEQEFELLSHSEDIINKTGELYNEFYEQENSILDTFTHAHIQLEKYSDMSADIGTICSRLVNIIEGIQDTSQLLRTVREKIASDPERLNDIRQKLDLINSLKTKYKLPTVEALLAYQQKIEQAILSQDSNSDEIRTISLQIDIQFAALTETADRLTDHRRKSAVRLAKDIVQNVKQLSIPNAQIEIQIDKKAEGKILISDISKVYSDTGQDNIEIRFSANVGSPILPLKSIVSGGELSRILLATKKSLASVLPPRTIILDEIDVGIGGKTAGSLAEFIYGLSKSHQVICITHLAKIAAVADNHISIEKKTLKNTTTIEVENLNQERRIEEIARMLSGHITELSEQHAKELLNIIER
jgi:DNA repair protein RecN (Recombination protein N)